LVSESPETALHRIAWSGMARPEFDRPIITPFVIPTVLAALWSVLRNLDSWSGAVATAIRLGGDVDTLGAIVGALMGTRLGLGGIPGHLVEAVLASAKTHSIGLGSHVFVSGPKTRTFVFLESAEENQMNQRPDET